MAYVELRNVTKLFGTVRAVDALNLSIEKGECFSFLGPSGCGKTTTLRMVAGFEDLDEGEIEVGGKLISSKEKNFYIPPENRGFGMVFQAFAVWPHMTVYDNVAFPLKIKHLSRSEVEDRTKQALANTNLTKQARLYPNDLSGGEKQRIALARALSINPGLLLLDEPLSNLDPHLREEMRFEIKDLQRKYDFSIIFVTHDQSEAMALSNRIMVMRDGRTMQIDTPLDIYAKPANRFVYSFIGLSNFVPVVFRDGKAVVESAPDAGVVSSEVPPQFSAAGHAAAACRPSEINFVSEGEGGVKGVIMRTAYLGEIVDYMVKVGESEIRVQKGRRDPRHQTGDTCFLHFPKIVWYE
ncbi:MAG: ABC transporter ATP-binding protein [Cloacibacillus sp.]